MTDSAPDPIGASGGGALPANIAARLEERAARHPDRPAIVEGRGRRRRVITFGELAGRVARLAGGLYAEPADAGAAAGDGTAAGDERADRDVARRLRPGDRTLLFVPMSIDLYTALLAVLHGGGVAVFVDAWAGRKRLEDAVSAAAPRGFIGTPKAHVLRLLSPSLRRIPVRVMAGRGPFSLDRHLAPRAGDGATAGPRAPADRAPDDHALVTFTTGSTGRPKAAARSHGFLWAQHEVLAEHLGLREDDVDMPTLPVFVLNNLALGVTTVLPHFDPRRPADIDPAAVLAQMREEGVTTTAGSPAFYERLVEHLEAGPGDEARIPVRALFTGGAPVFPPLADRLDRWTEGDAEILYGSTEAEPISGIGTRALVDASAEPGVLGICAGRPVPEIEVKLIRPVDGPVVLGAEGWAEWEVGNSTGEIVVSGEHVLRGYLDDPASEALAKIRDGDGRVWHRTGDGGRFDDEGRLWLMGRVSQRVERPVRGPDGQERLEVWWPMAAEARAVEVDGVRHAAYLGTSTARATLCVEAVAGAGSPELERSLRAALAPIPVDEIRFLDRIPRDPRHASKTDVGALRELLAGG